MTRPLGSLRLEPPSPGVTNYKWPCEGIQEGRRYYGEDRKKKWKKARMKQGHRGCKDVKGGRGLDGNAKVLLPNAVSKKEEEHSKIRNDRRGKGGKI